MEASILKSTKKILGVASEYTAFDLDIITHINSTFSILSQIGIGPVYGFAIEDDQAEWSDIDLPRNQLGMVRTYVFLKVRILFDPPATSFLIEASNKQIEEHEVRLSYFREDLIPVGAATIGAGNFDGTPPPPSGTDDGWLFVFDQPSLSTIWTVVHNLDGFPFVSTVDTAGTVIHGSVHYDSADQVTITFSEPLSGRAFLS